MADQTSGRHITGRGVPTWISMPIQASTKLYAGAAATRDSSGNIGVRTDAERLMGLVREEMDNSSGSAAQAGRDVDIYCRGVFRIDVSGAAAGDEGKAVFCSTDDQTFAYTPKAAQFVGNVQQYNSSGKVWVDLNPGSMNWNTWSSFADDATLDLPTAEEAIVIVTGGAEGGVFHVTTAGAVTKLSGTTNTAATDSDNNLCVYDAGTYARVKNRLGSTKRIAITYMSIAS